ncbi:hypothetical protein Mapa_009269 [Marchantia paleacea]|nr:hypothetical protein Mapa_009269 [Marchantia paleacea]
MDQAVVQRQHMMQQQDEVQMEPQKPAAKRKKRQVISASTATFTELQKILQEMRPYTLQVLRTPYYRNCKAARNMRRGMRQIRDLCKQVRIETVSLGKRNKVEGTRRRRRPVKPAPIEDGIVSPPGGEEVTRSDIIAGESQDGRNGVTEVSELPGVESSPLDSPTAPSVHSTKAELITPKSEFIITPKPERIIV